MIEVPPAVLIKFASRPPQTPDLGPCPAHIGDCALPRRKHATSAGLWIAMCIRPLSLWIVTRYSPSRLWARVTVSPREHGVRAVEVPGGAVDDGAGKR